ncbi:MAG TPA: hypothetical protein PKE30_19005 [Niabella sp.]|nr:hypothetical protein [Niabella sp.]
MRTKFFLISTLCLLTVFFSCRKDRGDKNNTAATLKMEIGGEGMAWEANKGVAIGTSYIDGKHNLTIAGVDQDFNGEASGFSLVLSQSAEIGVGNYLISSSTDGGASLTKVNGKTYLAGKGASGVALALEITEVSGSGNTKKFKGRFQGQMQGALPTDKIGLTGEFASF